MKPNFFIVGAAKSGTTLIYKTLEENSNFAFSKVKETHYLLKDLYDQDEYFEYFKVERKYVGEGSVSYLPSYEKVIPKIKLINPSSKIIIVIRNPFERFVSHYQYYKQLGYEADSLENCFSINHRPKFDPWKQDYNPYLEGSLYSDAINAYKEAFEDVLVLTFDQVINQPNFTCSELSELFDTKLTSNAEKQKVVNETLVPKVKILDSLLSVEGKRYLANLLPYNLKIMIKKTLYKKPKRDNIKFPLELLNCFNNEIKVLEETLNLDLKAWYKK